MNIQKIMIPLAGLAVVALAYRTFGWAGIAAAVTGLVMWMLLHFTKMMQVLKRAAGRPIGYVDSAVMLNVKLKPGMNLMHVVAMTRALGERLSDQDVQPEIFRWADAGLSSVTCTFVGGRLSHYELHRPPADDAKDETAGKAAGESADESANKSVDAPSEVAARSAAP